MRIHCILHAAFENPGIIEAWAREKSCQFSMTHTYRAELLPEVNDFDFLVVMGGPQSAVHLDKWPYLRDEIALIQKVIAANKPVLGICLGAQLIAESQGAKTERSPQREIGVFSVDLLPEAKEDPIFSQFPDSFLAMHWHNDMPGLPKNARLLAKSAGCPRQAFSIGDRVYGLQCHLEMTQNNIAQMMPHCENELTADIYVDSKQKLLAYDLKHINEKMFVILDHLYTISKIHA